MFPGHKYDTRPMSLGTSFGQDESYFQSPFSHREWVPSNVAFLNLLFLSHHGCQKGFWVASTHFNAGICSTGSPPRAQPGQQHPWNQPHLLSLLSHFSFSMYGLYFGCSAMNSDSFKKKILLLWRSINKASCRIALIHLEIYHSWGSDDVTDDISFPQDINVSYLAIYLEYVIKLPEVAAYSRQWGRRESSKISVTGRLNPLVMSVPMLQDKELTPRRFNNRLYKIYLMVLNGD